MAQDLTPPTPNSFLKTPASTPKVDYAIVNALTRLTNLAAQSYNTQAERKYKYYAMQDLIFTIIDPLLMPKVDEPEWRDRYHQLMNDLKHQDRLESSPRYFRDVLQKLMQLYGVVLFSSGYYLIESLNDEQYMKMAERGGISVDL